MRKLLFSMLLAAAGATGLATSGSADAFDGGRVYIDIGDVSFSYGRPYWRYNREPLYVVYERGYPRYYRVVDRGYRYGYDPYWRYDDRYVRYDRFDRYDRYDRRHRHGPRDRYRDRRDRHYWTADRSRYWD